MDYSDKKIDLVLNKVTKPQYDNLVLSNLIEDSQMYLVEGDSVDGNSRYSLFNLTPTLSSVTLGSTTIQALTCQAYDLAINTVSVTLSDYPLYVYMPESPNNCGARDFCVRIECLASTAPSLAFIGSGTESCDFESEDDEWATLEPGTNLYNFTETKRNSEY